ncbi:ATP-dependent zinc metalloprotease FtsH [Patescibacteria group bacterium]|nr:ATP-dependent zinc metalloprotease FtsH [Patescibacteria group bacterium]
MSFSPTLRNSLIILVILGVIGWGFSTINLENKTTPINITTLVQEARDRQVESIEVKDTALTVKLKDGKTQTLVKENGQPLSELLTQYGLDTATLQSLAVKVVEPSAWDSVLLILLSNGLPILIFVGLLFYMMRQAQNQGGRALSFGQSTAKESLSDDKNRLTFADAAGAKEAKQELLEVVEFLRKPEKFAKLGAKIPKGVLLMGGPGTGKTLLARATAGEANVPFFHLSGSEFVEMFVGVGASRVRDLFDRAKKSAPCIIFIDEIDAVGRQRGSGIGGSHDEREQTLNQILVEMDGFEPNLGVIVMAATNRPDVLDPALLRPGRFDRRLVIDPPDLNDREEILKIHAKNKPLASDVNLRRIAERTPGFSGADLANLMNEAAILTGRENRETVTPLDIINSIEKVMLGPERRSHLMNDEERKVTAYHEAGHALVAYLSPTADAVHKISIISRGRAAGYTIKLPVEDRRMRRSSEYLEDIAMMLGGYSAEKTVFGDITTGASNDMQNATRVAHDMVTQWGMSELLGPRVYGQQNEMVFLGRDMNDRKDYSESRAEIIDQEIDRIIKQGLKTANEMLASHRETLDKLANHLVEHETIERDEVEKIIGFPPANKKNVFKEEQI